MQKYGFVYIWRDRKHKKYYIGCHWGFEDDGYISSSRWMRNSYRRRPDDFKRRILSRVYTNRQDLLDEEFKYLQKIKDTKIKNTYYNLTKYQNGHWSTKEESRLTVGQKISKSLKGKSFENSGKWRKGERSSISTEFKNNEAPWNKGKTLEELYSEEKAKEYRKKLSDSHKGNIPTNVFKKGHKTWNKGLKRISITNGFINEFLYDESENYVIPEGWRRGMTRKKNMNTLEIGN